MRRSLFPLRYENRILLLTLASGLPATMAVLGFLWLGGYEARVAWTGTVVLVGLWLGFAAAVRRRVIFPLQTLANLLQASREGDFSLRGRSLRGDDVLGEVLREVNDLSSTLMEQRLGAVEAEALLRNVVARIDVALFSFDGDGILKLVNPAGERLLAQPAERLLGRSAETLGLAELLVGPEARTAERIFPSGEGRWGIRRSGFREGGLPYQLLMIANLSQALRDEERQAWKRLIRVLGHELNNSLTPIKSMASTLASLLERDSPPDDWEEDARRGLAVIAERAEGLARFMSAYSRLARLPAPDLAPIKVAALVERVASLEHRLAVEVAGGRDVELEADADQLEQLLINLVRNAVDAALETGGGVRVSWVRRRGELELRVDDEGHGLPATANLFVPFFTTKPAGSGIGLVLCRQIAEAHGGTVRLGNRREAAGCRATVRLPLGARRERPAAASAAS